jgi:multidrug efflux pump subunit AcrA (membrane-fusion protein)
MISRIFNLIGEHKRTAVIGLIIIVIGGYFSYKNLVGDGDIVRYIAAAAEKGTLIVSISGSGQVSVSDQIDIKPKVSGDVVYVGVENGQEVKTGTFLVQIDTSDAEKEVRDAKTALETAQLELDELLEPPDELDLLMAENNLAQAKELKQKAEDNLEKSYEDGFNDVADAFLDLPTIMGGLKDILFGNDFNLSQDNIDYYAGMIEMYDNSVVQCKEDVNSSYQIAQGKYDQNFQNYKDASRYSETETIEDLIEETYETAKYIAEAIKDAKNLIDFHKDILVQKGFKVPSAVYTHQNTLDSYTGISNSHISGLLSIRRNIEDYKEAIINNERSIKELELSLADLITGTDSLSIRIKQIAVQQREDALLDAQEELADHYIRAPFDGIVAEVNAKKGESISSGNVAVIFITEQKIAEITINEIDVAKVEVGQKTTITFDAIEDLSITGEVTEIDTLGTVSQGVVTYDVKIAFDTQDERVKPGMSISVVIITNTKQNVLLVPNSAIKYQGDIQYVEVMRDDNTSRSQQIEIGLSNDMMTEIISGLQEGFMIVTKKVGTSNTASVSSGFSVPPGGSSMQMMRKMTK